MLGVFSWPLLRVAGRVGYPPQLPAPLWPLLRLCQAESTLLKVLHYADSRVDLYCAGASKREERKKKRKTQPLQIISVTNRLRLCAPTIALCSLRLVFTPLSLRRPGVLLGSTLFLYAFSPERFHPRAASLFPCRSPERCRFPGLGTRTIRIHDREHLLRSVMSGRR